MLAEAKTADKRGYYRYHNKKYCYPLKNESQKKHKCLEHDQ